MVGEVTSLKSAETTNGGFFFLSRVNSQHSLSPSVSGAHSQRELSKHLLKLTNTHKSISVKGVYDPHFSDEETELL